MGILGWTSLSQPAAQPHEPFQLRIPNRFVPLVATSCRYLRAINLVCLSFRSTPSTPCCTIMWMGCLWRYWRVGKTRCCCTCWSAASCLRPSPPRLRRSNPKVNKAAVDERLPLAASSSSSSLQSGHVLFDPRSLLAFSLRFKHDQLAIR